MITIDVSQCCNEPIIIGRQKENEVIQIQFDFSVWAEDYGEGNFTLTAMRSGETIPYDVVGLEVDSEDHKAIWTVSDADNAINGYGEAQANYNKDSKVKESAIFATYSGRSLPTSGDPPSPLDDWMDDLREIKTEAIEQTEAIKNQAVQQTTQIKNDAVQQTTNIKNEAVQQTTEIKNQAQTAANSAKDEADRSHREAEAAARSAEAAASVFTFTDPNNDGNIVIIRG